MCALFAVIAGGGTIGPIIPPSIPMIVYGSTTGDSIGALFAGGIVLGGLIAVAQLVVVYFIAKKRGYGVAVEAIVGAATAVAWVLTYERVPQEVTEAMVSGIDSSAFFMIVSFGVLVVIGMIMDLTAAILILTTDLHSAGVSLRDRSDLLWGLLL